MTCPLRQTCMTSWARQVVSIPPRYPRGPAKARAATRTKLPALSPNHTIPPQRPQGGLMRPAPLSVEELRRAAARLPRLHLAHLPTPLEEVPRFAGSLGGPRLFIKRDDCTGLLM